MTKRSQSRKAQEYGQDSDGHSNATFGLTYVDKGSHVIQLTLTALNIDFIPLQGVIDWGDTNTSSVTSNPQTHTYSGANTYTVKWTPNFGTSTSVSASIA